MITVSMETAQGPLVTDHVKRYAPVINPVTELEAEEGLTKVTVDGPDTKPQFPAPNTGVFPASVVVVTLHNAWSGPALAVVGGAYTTTSVESVAAQPVGARVVILYLIVAVVNPVFVRMSAIVVEEVPTKLVVAPVVDPKTLDVIQVYEELGMELLNWILVALPVQIVAALLVIVMAGLGLTVAMNVKGVPLQVLFVGEME